MTPSFRWVFLLALVGRAASVPDPVVVDACALLCNPGAETESERARDPKLYPRYSKVNCHPQSVSDDDQAWRIASSCLKLCNEDLSVEMEVNCFALRSSLGSNLGCYCEALTPLSPNTMRLHESWRLNFLVKELAKDIMDVILDSPLDMMILCEIHSELYNDYSLKLPETGRIIDLCKNESLRIRSTRSVDYEDSLEDEDVVEVKAEEELLADGESEDRVIRETKKSEQNEEDVNKPKYDPRKRMPRKEEKAEMEKKKKANNIDLGRKDDSGKNNVKDNAKEGDAMHSKNIMEDIETNKKKDNAVGNMENNEKNATNEAKSKEKLLAEEKNKMNARSNLRGFKSAQNNKKVKENNKNTNQQNDMKDDVKNAAKDNAKNDKEDSKTDSKKDDAKNDEKRDKRDNEKMDALTLDEMMMNDQAELDDEIGPDDKKRLSEIERKLHELSFEFDAHLRYLVQKHTVCLDTVEDLRRKLQHCNNTQ